MDFGWKSFRYEIRNSRNQVIEKGGAPATPEDLKAILEKYRGRNSVVVAFEAGSQLYWVDEAIKEMGQDSYPFHAAHFHQTVKSKNKTDKKDAEKIAIAAVKDNLPPRIYVPGGVERRLRELLTERATYKKELNTTGNRLHALAMESGFRLGKKSLSRDLVGWDEAQERFAGTKREREARRLYRMALNLMQLIEEIEEEIWTLGHDGDAGKVRARLETIPGVGFWTAMALIAWCGLRAERFPKSRNAASYFGLVRSVYESGQISRPGHITKTGPPLVRKLATQAAWAFIRSEAGSASAWGRWSRAMTSKDKDRRKKATVALARRIVTAAVACLRNETVWNPAVLESKR